MNWSPMKVGGALIALAMLLAFCMGVCVLSVFAPAPPPAQPWPPAATPSLIVPGTP